MKILFFVLILILAACTPSTVEVTVTPTASATFTPPPTATITPTSTTAPEFLSVQTQVAESNGDFKVLENGEIEGILPDGTIGVISGITLNPDGQNFTITVNGENISIDASKVEINDAGIYVEGYVYDTTKGMFVEGFNIEAWAGTDPNRLEFVKTLDALGYPRENVTCNEKGVCFDPEGNEIGRNGVFKMDFAKEAAIKYGNPKATQFGPRKGNVLPGTETDESYKNVVFPLFRAVRAKLIIINNGVDVFEKGKSAHSSVFLNQENNSWGVSIVINRSDPNSLRYFAYENENGELVIVRTK